MTSTDNTFLGRLEQRQERVSAVVLAGGLARRMAGQDKGLIKVCDKPMTAWVVEAIRPKVHSIIINANRNHDEYYSLLSDEVNGGAAQVGEHNGADVVADRHTGHIGPLAGLSAAIHHSDSQYMFMCPCDSPFVDANLVDVLGNALVENDADVSVAHDGDRLQPVFCIVNRRCLDSLDSYLESGERKIDRWYAQVKTQEVECASFVSSFRNINTEEEREAAEKELSL